MTGIRRSRTKEMEEIAIVGISGRYPLANTLEELWERLKAYKTVLWKLMGIVRSIL